MFLDGVVFDTAALDRGGGLKLLESERPSLPITQWNNPANPTQGNGKG